MYTDSMYLRVHYGLKAKLKSTKLIVDLIGVFMMCSLVYVHKCHNVFTILLMDANK